MYEVSCPVSLHVCPLTFFPFCIPVLRVFLPTMSETPGSGPGDAAPANSWAEHRNLVTFAKYRGTNINVQQCNTLGAKDKELKKIQFVF